MPIVINFILTGYFISMSHWQAYCRINDHHQYANEASQTHCSHLVTMICREKEEIVLSSWYHYNTFYVADKALVVRRKLRPFKQDNASVSVENKWQININQVTV